MGRNKPRARKSRMARAQRSTNPVPLWVVAKTLGKVRRRGNRRNWRRSRMQP